MTPLMHLPKSSAGRTRSEDLPANPNCAESNRGVGDAVCSERWILRLYVAGQSTRSLRAVANLEKLCSEHLRGRYKLEVFDLYQEPHLAQTEQIVAVPALVRRLPAPLRMLIGDMLDSDRVLIGLELSPP